MRTMYDSTNPNDIPTSAQMVAGYVDGIYGPNFKSFGLTAGWDAAGWGRFPGSARARIAISAATNDGHVLDVENGDATPAQAPGWVRMRIAAGLARPTLYVNRSNWAAVAAACAGLPVDWWVATLDGTKAVAPPAGAIAPIAVQYANAAASGGHYDLSAVADSWPGVDSAFGAAMGQLGGNMTTDDLIQAHDQIQFALWGVTDTSAQSRNDFVFAVQHGTSIASIIAGWKQNPQYAKWQAALASIGQPGAPANGLTADEARQLTEVDSLVGIATALKAELDAVEAKLTKDLA